MVKPAAGYRPLAYSSPEAVQTTGTVAGLFAVAVDNCQSWLELLNAPSDGSRRMIAYNQPIAITASS
jgi:hypothetical protein